MIKPASTEESIQGKNELIRKTNLELGHAGIEDTTAYLRNSGAENIHRKEVQVKLENCELSKRFTSRRGGKNAVRLSLHEPFFRVGIDIIGPLPKSELETGILRLQQIT